MSRERPARSPRSATESERSFVRVDYWLIAIWLLVSGCYLASAFASNQAAISRAPSGYYGLLVRGFESGHLYVALEPHPGLLALADPYDPETNAPYRVHDMSLWKGKYYLYFGVTPAVTFFWPFRILSGYYPTEPLAVAVFSVGAFSFAHLTLRSATRRYFLNAPASILTLGALALGLMSPVWLLNQGAQFYQVAISAGAFFQMLCFWALYHALHSERRVRLWLSWASLAFGLTLGARPNYFPVGLLLVSAGIFIGLHPPGNEKRKFRWMCSLALPVLAPAFVVGVALLLYNWLRFGSLTEFGMTYQLAGMKVMSQQSMSPANFRPHLFQYLFQTGTWSRYFPFFIPPGTALGTLRYFPWLWLGPVGIAALFVTKNAKTGKLLFFSSLLFLAGVCNLGLISFFFGITTERYRSDFVPAWLLLAGVSAGMLATEWSAMRWRLRLIFGAGLFSLFIALASFSRGLATDGFILPVARVANWPAYALERLQGKAWGPLQLQLTLPKNKTGVREPLVQTGKTESERDWWWIEYLSADRAQLGYFHAGWGSIAGQEFAVPPDGKITVELKGGGLLPPLSHPLFAGWKASEYRRSFRDLSISVNGKVVLEGAMGAYASDPAGVIVGQLSTSTGGITDRFSGKILEAKRLPFSTTDSVAMEIPGDHRPLELQVYFPADRSQGSEPLVVTGEGKNSDLVYCVFEGPGKLRFALDHFGNGGPQSDLLTFDPFKPHVLRIWMGSFSAPADSADQDGKSGRLIVTMDGEEAFNREQVFFPAGSKTIRLGTNPFHSSAAETEFTGRIVSQRSFPFSELPAAKLLIGAYGSADLTLEFPLSALGAAEPLVVTGKTGAGDLLYVRYLDSGHVSFGFDHWGVSGIAGEPVAIDYNQPHRVTLTMPSLFPRDPKNPMSGKVEVSLDGKRVLQGQSEIHPTTRNQIYLFSNPIGGSTTGPNFTGRVIDVKRVLSR